MLYIRMSFLSILSTHFVLRNCGCERYVRSLSQNWQQSERWFRSLYKSPGSRGIGHTSRNSLSTYYLSPLTARPKSVYPLSSYNLVWSWNQVKCGTLRFCSQADKEPGGVPRENSDDHSEVSLYDALKLSKEEEEEIIEYCRSLNEEEEEIFEVLKMEHERVLVQKTEHSIKEFLTCQDWKTSMAMPKKNSREKFYRYSAKRQFMVAKERQKKMERKERYRLRKESLEEADLENNSDRKVSYLPHHRISLQMKAVEKMKVARAIVRGTPLIFDCSCYSDMDNIEKRSFYKQIGYCHLANKTAAEPYNLIFSNVTSPELRDRLDTCNFMWTITKENFCDLYPTERLVYLSPDAPKYLTNYDPSDVYIVGAYVDKKQVPRMTYGMAKRLGIRSAKLPLHILDWKQGTKSLTLNCVLNILLDFKNTENWEFAFRHIPRRFLGYPD